jgi:hypothetical protein
MDRLVERMDFGVREELDFPVDWEIFVRGTEAPTAPRDCSRAVVSSAQG